MSVRVRVEGLDDLKRKLRDLDAKQIKELSIGPLLGAGHIFENEARAKAPRDSGELAESMDTEVDDEIAHAAVRSGPRAFYGLFQEFGWTVTGERGRVRGQPFMRPAYAAKKAEMQQHAVSGIAKAIERRAARS